MALHTGGIFSRARGQTSGIIFSEVRTLSGKGMISKQKVIPANPRTVSQQEIRSRFSRMKLALKEFGEVSYQQNLNRGYGQLPGYQTFEKMLLTSLNLDGSLKAINPVSTGNAPGWEEGQISFGAIQANRIDIIPSHGSTPYPAGTTIHGWVWVDFDGDWRTLEDYELVYAQDTLVSPNTQISLTVILEDDLVDQVSDSLVFWQIQYPAQSPRRRSFTASQRSKSLEIQDMVWRTQV